jgi:hypothetical protein
LLQIDHINPVAEGGSNDIVNLLTACAACNSGKRDRKLDDKTVVVKRKAQLDELQERREQLEMMMSWTNGLQDITTMAIDHLAAYWTKLAPGYEPNSRGRQSIRRWLNKYSTDEIIKAMDIAAAQYLDMNQNGTVTKESWDKAYGKIPNICSVRRDAEEDPDLQDLLYIRGIVRNRCNDRYFDNANAMAWLRAARNWGATIAQLKNVAYQTHNYNYFIEELTRLINYYKSVRGSSGAKA